MEVFVYGKKRPLPGDFHEFLTVSDTAIVSIDLHQGHLADTPDCPCPAPRAREVGGIARPGVEVERRHGEGGVAADVLARARPVPRVRNGKAKGGDCVPFAESAQGRRDDT